MATNAGLVAETMRAAHRQMGNCPDCIDHDPADHVQRAFDLLGRMSVKCEVIKEGVGRYKKIPCELFTFKDGSRAYIPEVGWGADGMMYVLRK